MYSEVKEILELDSMKNEGSALDHSLDTGSCKLNVKDQLCNTHVKQSTEVFMIDNQVFDPELDIPEEFDISFDPSRSNQSDVFDIDELLGIKKPITNDSTLVKNYSLRGTVVKPSDIESLTHDATNIKQGHTPFRPECALSIDKHLVTSNQDEMQVLGVNMSIYEHDKISGHNTKHHNTFSKIEDTKDCDKVTEKTKTIVDTKGLPTEACDGNVPSKSLCTLKQVSKSFSSLKKPSGHGTFNSSPVRSYQLEEMKASVLYNKEDCQTQITQEEDSSTSGVVSDSLQSSICTNEDIINDSGSSSTSQLSVASNKSSEVLITKKNTKPVNRNSKLQMQKSKSLLPSKPTTGGFSKPMKKQSFVSKPVSKSNVLPPPSNKEKVVLPSSNKERVVLPSSNKERVVLPSSNKERVVLPPSNKERVVSRLPSRQGSFRQKQGVKTLPVAQTKMTVSNSSKPSMMKEPTKNLAQSSKYGLNPRPTSQGGIRKPVINKTTQLLQKPMKPIKNKTANGSVVTNSTDPNFTDTTTCTSLSPAKIHSTPKSKDQISVAHTTPHRLVCKSTPINAHLSFSSMEHISSPLEKVFKKENEGKPRGVALNTHSGRKRRSLIPTPSTNVHEPVHKDILAPIPINLDDGETRMRTTIDPIKKLSVAPPRILGPLKKPKGNLKPQMKTRKVTETKSGPLRPKRSVTTSHDYDPEYEMKLLKRTENSRPKVMHSPIDKENRPATPHSEWSPIKRKKIVDMQDPCFQCTKYYIGMKRQ